MQKSDTEIEQICDTNSAKIRVQSLYFYFAAKIWTHLQTRDAQFPSILLVFAKVAIFRNTVAFFIVLTKKKRTRDTQIGHVGRDDLGIPLRRNERFFRACRSSMTSFTSNTWTTENIAVYFCKQTEALCYVTKE